MTFATCGHFEKITRLPTMPFYLVTTLTLCLTEKVSKKGKETRNGNETGKNII